MHLTRLLLPQMIDRKAGKVLNIASIAAFEPGPFMSVYYATKAFVLSFSEALGCELKNSGVSVTAACPGPTKTGFESAAGEGTDKLFSKIKNSTAEEVALYSYYALMRNKPVAIHGMINRFMVWGQRFLPRSVVRNMVYKIQK
ncbi:Sulfoacetaldehyde reductase [compost metagenome]